MATRAAIRETMPRKVAPACAICSQWVIMNPGWMTHVRIESSAIVTPLLALINDLRLRTWPRNETKTVTKDNSIVFAKRANTMEAVAGVKEPREWITLPYRGCMRARRSHMPEKTEEYTESMIIEMESQLARFRWISCLVGQPSIKPGKN